MDIDQKIYYGNEAICRNIESLHENERGLLSQNILSQLRNFLECIFVKIYMCAGNPLVENDYQNIKNAVKFMNTLQGKYRFLNQFHKLLQISVSHYTLDPDSSERLMLKYYEYLLRIKTFMRDNYRMELLENLHKFPLDTDTAFTQYYEAIAKVLENKAAIAQKTIQHGRFYIEKSHPVIIHDTIFYEVTFIPAHNKSSKFDRIIAFTKQEISSYYAVELHLAEFDIQVLGRRMPIVIIVDWSVSIRACEFSNFAKIFGRSENYRGLREYSNLMQYLTKSGMNLVELMEASNEFYADFMSHVQEGTKNNVISSLLTVCRNFIAGGMEGTNVVRYLLYHLNNKIIKRQLSKYPCQGLSGLYLYPQCIPFDRIPFNFSLSKHNPSVSDLFYCIDSSGRKHELFARFIKNNTECNGVLYTPVSDVQHFEEPEVLAEKYNGILYRTHQHLRIECDKGHFYIKEYEDHVRTIISNLLDHTGSGVRNYVNSVEAWMRTSGINIDSEEKSKAIKNLFKDSKVALVYGPAGTGKSMMINYISLFFKENHKIFLANTNPAVENLRRKVTAENADFMTITKFLSAGNSDTECDILCVDECSTVSNRDMVKILEKSTFQLLLLVGDVYQIESILFGNWFSIAHFMMPKSAVVELTTTYRTTDHGLKEVWDRVRRITDDRLEFITRNGFSSVLDDSIFSKSAEDEIVLCLNYDGLYGINNINKFLQSNNPNPPVRIGVQTYKVGDPVLFNESDRFSPLIYNNLKGKILSIEEMEDCVYFTIEIYMAINELDVSGLDLELLDSVAGDTSVIRFRVELQNDGDEDDDDVASVVPFQIAYAVSIHKAQGLEYDSVKVVITNEIEEMISHNIFYTAITRAREKLKIYWSPETENRILKNMKEQFNDKDYKLFKEKFKAELNCF